MRFFALYLAIAVAIAVAQAEDNVDNNRKSRRLIDVQLELPVGVEIGLYEPELGFTSSCT